MITARKNFEGLNLTINTTEQCNLRCKYCYELNKRENKIPLDYVEKFIDVILEDPDPVWALKEKKEKEENGTKSFFDISEVLTGKSFIIDFIGGDSLANPDVVDHALSYWMYKLNILNHKGKNSWRSSLSTNGTYFQYKDVRDLCLKYKDNFSIGVSIDGCPELHDLNRVFPDGSGSMKTILEWWPWLEYHFPETAHSTKATLSKQSIPYLYDSLVFMHEVLGMNQINQNFIMEANGCTEEDYKLLEEQMEKCCEYVLEHRHEMFWSMLDKMGFGYAHGIYNDDYACQGHCGSGSMPCLSLDGNIYPCFRWLPFTHNNESKAVDMKCGDIWNGLNHKEVFAKVRKGSSRNVCSKDPKCLECDIESACAYCIAGCFSEFGDFIRTTHICELAKSNVRWARYYWKKYNELEGLPEEDFSDNKKNFEVQFVAVAEGPGEKYIPEKVNG